MDEVSPATPHQFIDLPSRTLTGEDKLRWLTTDESQHFRMFCDRLWSTEEDKQLVVLYRGENRRNLSAKLCREERDHEEGRLLSRLLYFGDKAKCFLKAASSPRKRDFLTGFDDASDKTFCRMHSLLFSVFQQQGAFGTIRRFKAHDPAFVDFFLKHDAPTLPALLKGMKRWDRLQLRDHYLLLLHAFQDKAIGDGTLLVSATSRRAAARKFANRHKADQGGPGVIIICFLPAPFHRYAIGEQNIADCFDHYVSTDVPVYREAPYSEDREITLRGALFPHFIIGIEDLTTNTIVVNPRIFDKANGNWQRVFSAGLIVGQEAFDERLASTAYRGYVETMGNDVEFRI